MLIDTHSAHSVLEALLNCGIAFHEKCENHIEMLLLLKFGEACFLFP